MNKVSLTLSFEADKLEAMDVFLKKTVPASRRRWRKP